MRKFLFLFLIGFLTCQALSQTDEIDSLQLVLSKLQAKDPTYVNVANEIAFELSMTDQRKSIYYINLAISVAKDINYQKGLIRATTLKGNSFLIIGLPDQALSYYLETLTYDVSKYPLENVRLFNNIGEVYRRKEVFDSSLKYFNKALVLATNELPDFQPVIILSNLGEVSLMKNDVVSAERYFEECLTNSIESNDYRGQGYGYFGLAECAFLGGDIRKAIKLQHQSLESRLLADHKRGLIQSYLKLGQYYESGINNDSALFFWRKAEDLALSFESNDLLSETYNKLYSFYFKSGDIANAAKYLDYHKNLGDSIRNAEFIANVDKMQSALKAELVIAENRLLKQEQQQAKSEEDARLIVIALGVLIIGGLGFTTYQYRKKQRVIKEASSETIFTTSLLSFSNELNSADLNLNFFLQNLLKKSREVLNCDRATFWELDSEDSIYLKLISEKAGVPSIPPAKFSREEFPLFFNDFLANRTVAVSNISQDPRLTDIYEKYFKQAGIESILNAPILIDKKFIGFVSFTMLRRTVRDWHVQEQRYVGSLADLIVAAIAKNRGNILELEKEELIQKLRIRNKSLREFNSVISHNIREPLTQIIGFSELLQSSQTQDIENSSEIIPKISSASHRIDTVIKELSTILNESDPRPSDFRLISLEKLIREVFDLLKSEIKTKNITIDQTLKIDKIVTYKAFLSDALYHLISNSLKFSKPDERLHLNIESYEDELHHYIKISDNGRGMNLDQFGDKVFKMYQRFHLDTEGRGIGLFIVKNRITAINGLIELESKEEVGTSFTIKLPKEPNRI